MGRSAWAVVLAVSLAGCMSQDDDLLREYNADGMNLYQHGDFLPARESFQAALALRPNDADLIYNIGECYDRQAPRPRPRSGSTTVSSAPRTTPLAGMPSPLCSCAPAAPTRPAGWPRNGSNAAPKEADPYALDGWLWFQKGDLPRAQGRLQQALDLDPHNVRALLELGLLYEKLGRPDRAIVLYERALEIEPSNTEVTHRLNQLQNKGAGRPQPE